MFVLDLFYLFVFRFQKIKSNCISILKRHITALLPQCGKIISKAEDLVRQHQSYISDITGNSLYFHWFFYWIKILLKGVICIADILFHSITGSMLSNVLHSVLLIQDEVLYSTSSLLMDLLKPLDRYNKHLHFINDSAASKWNVVAFIWWFLLLCWKLLT